jgi:hypothetical protein
MSSLYVFFVSGWHLPAKHDTRQDNRGAGRWAPRNPAGWHCEHAPVAPEKCMCLLA